MAEVVCVFYGIIINSSDYQKLCDKDNSLSLRSDLKTIEASNLITTHLTIPKVLIEIIMDYFNYPSLHDHFEAIGRFANDIIFLSSKIIEPLWRANNEPDGGINWSGANLIEIFTCDYFGVCYHHRFSEDTDYNKFLTNTKAPNTEMHIICQSIGMKPAKYFARIQASGYANTEEIIEAELEFYFKLDDECPFIVRPAPGQIWRKMTTTPNDNNYSDDDGDYDDDDNNDSNDSDDDNDDNNNGDDDNDDNNNGDDDNDDNNNGDDDDKYWRS